MPTRQKRSYLQKWGQKGGQNAGRNQGRNRSGQPTKPNAGRGPTDKQRAKSQQRVTEPLDMRGLRKETRAATNQRFRPLEKEIGGELRASNRRVGEVGDWWQNYLDTVNQGRAETQAAYAQAGATNTAQIAQAGAIDSANTQALQGEAAKSAELRGVAPSTAPAERETAAQAQRNYLAAAQGGATQQMGANQFAYLTDQKRIGVGQSIASRKEEQRRGRSIMKDRRDVRRERGDYATTKRGELRAEERDYLIQRQAFGLDKKKAAQDAADAAVDNRIAQQNANSSTRSSKASAKNAATTAKNATKNGGLTPSEQRTVQNEKEAAQRSQQSANQTARSLYAAAKKKPETDAEWQAFILLVASEAEGADQVNAKRAVMRLKRSVSQGSAMNAVPAGR